MTLTHAAAPDTVTEAVRFLSEHGYIEDFEFNDAATGDPALPTGPAGVAIVDYTFRFEGPSDPADEAIVLGVPVPDSNRKGVIVSAFGSDADPAHARLLVQLSRAVRYPISNAALAAYSHRPSRTTAASPSDA